MVRNRPSHLIVCLLGLMVVALGFANTTVAGSTVTVTGAFTVTEAGAFAVTLSARPAGGCDGATPGDPAFGPYGVDAVGTAHGFTPEALHLCALYTDTLASRGPFVVQISINSFELNPAQVPSFDGSSDAHFQIPNRYLVLSTIGQVTGGNADQGVGAVSDVQADAGHDFSSGPLQIASVASGVGTVSSVQELGMTLNIPAGVYPGEYDSTITIETYTGP